MSDERKPTFAMFKNTDRKTDRSPEYSLATTCPHCRTEIKGAGWRKTSGKGLEYIGGPVEAKGERKPEPKPAAAPVDDFDDETLPF